MSLVLNVEILGEFRNLTAATNGAQSQLATLNGKINSFSNKAKIAFGSIGVGLSFVAITRELGEAAKAAIDDQKSQELLAAAIDKSTKATDEQKASVEKAIAQMSIMSSTADDKIRPAFATLVRSTGDVTKATGLMGLALDIAAGTGKDVETVAKALSKAVGPEGTTTALEKLVPAIKGTHDPLQKLHDLFDGNAKLAADKDPYARMQIALGELKESIGTSVLPVLESFASWFVEISPKIQSFFKDLTNPTTPMGEAWAALGKSFVEFGKTLNSVFTGGSKDANSFIIVLKSLKAILDTVIGLINIVTGKSAADAGRAAGENVNRVAGSIQVPNLTGGGRGPLTPIAPVTRIPALPTRNQPGGVSRQSVTINVKSISDAQTTVNSITKWEKSTGSSLASLLR